MEGEGSAPTADGAVTSNGSRSTATAQDAGASPVAIAEAITASAAGVVVPAAPPPIVDKQPMSARERGFVGSSLVAATLLLMTQLLAIWPAVVMAVVQLEDREEVTTPVLFGLGSMVIQPDVALIEMVMIAGALGALVGGCRRFIYFSSRDELPPRRVVIPHAAAAGRRARADRVLHAARRLPRPGSGRAP